MNPYDPTPPRDTRIRRKIYSSKYSKRVKKTDVLALVFAGIAATSSTLGVIQWLYGNESRDRLKEISEEQAVSLYNSRLDTIRNTNVDAKPILEKLYALNVDPSSINYSQLYISEIVLSTEKPQRFLMDRINLNFQGSTIGNLIIRSPKSSENFMNQLPVDITIENTGIDSCEAQNVFFMIEIRGENRIERCKLNNSLISINSDKGFSSNNKLIIKHSDISYTKINGFGIFSFEINSSIADHASMSFSFDEENNFYIYRVDMRETSIIAEANFIEADESCMPYRIQNGRNINIDPRQVFYEGCSSAILNGLIRQKNAINDIVGMPEHFDPESFDLFEESAASAAFREGVLEIDPAIHQDLTPWAN